MNKTETLHCRQEVPNEWLDKEPNLAHHIAGMMHTELGKMLADKICDGKAYRVLMEKPHIEIGDVGFNKNTSVYKSKISVTPIVMCQDCKYWVSDGGALMRCDIHKDPTVPDHYCSYGEEIVPLVRCKDCKSWSYSVLIDNRNRCERTLKLTKADDFCSYGEREGE